MDMSYATIQVYGGVYLRIKIEVRFIDTVCNASQAINHPIYVVDQDLGCFILVVNDESNVKNRIEVTVNVL